VKIIDVGGRGLEFERRRVREDKDFGWRHNNEDKNE